MLEFYFRRYYDRYLFIIEYGNSFEETGAFPAAEILINILILIFTSEEDERKGKLLRNEVRNGYIALEYLPFSFSGDYCDGVTETVISGFDFLAEKYPDLIKIS